ncbi:MAG TPA: hypothetical protein DCQ06_06245 [Myxococcales bacterium]|nr:hypothetical protein [Myxococcales bacterium]HAN31182.1 hypothetical protein [Myxococcales bacterium]
MRTCPLNYETVGDPHDPWVLWFHGLFGCGADWRSFAQALPGRYHLLIDLPGHGHSATIVESSWHRCVAELIEALVEPASSLSVVGYSMGARVAMGWLCHTLRQVDRAVLISGHPGLQQVSEREHRLQVDTERAAHLMQLGTQNYLHQWYQSELLQEIHLAEQSETLIARRARNESASVAAAMVGLSTGQQPDYVSDLGKRARHITWVAGARDARYVALLQRAHRKMPGSDLKIAPTVGHQVHLLQPQWLHRVLSDALPLAA